MPLLEGCSLFWGEFADEVEGEVVAFVLRESVDEGAGLLGGWGLRRAEVSSGSVAGLTVLALRWRALLRWRCWRWAGGIARFADGRSAHDEAPSFVTREPVTKAWLAAS